MIDKRRVKRPSFLGVCSLKPADHPFLPLKRKFWVWGCFFWDAFAARVAVSVDFVFNHCCVSLPAFLQKSHSVLSLAFLIFWAQLPLSLASNGSAELFVSRYSLCLCLWRMKRWHLCYSYFAIAHLPRLGGSNSLELVLKRGLLSALEDFLEFTWLIQAGFVKIFYIGCLWLGPVLLFRCLDDFL